MTKKAEITVTMPRAAVVALLEATHTPALAGGPLVRARHALRVGLGTQALPDTLRERAERAFRPDPRLVEMHRDMARDHQS